MANPPIDSPPSARPREDRLHSWKEIASYLKRDVTTVQRWEKREGMPVHRHLHDRMGTVYASRAELDAWMNGRNLPAGSDTESAVVPTAATPAEPQPAGVGSRGKMIFLLIGLSVLGIGFVLWLQSTERFWRNPIADARFQTVTDFDGLEQAAAISPDGHLIAFLSDRDKHMDIWITQVGSGEFHNLTHGSVAELGNPSIRSLGFSPDGALVTYWLRQAGGSNGDDIGVWAVPILGGEPRPFLPGAAEFDWSRDGARLAYHTPGPGDPLFVSKGDVRKDARPIFAAAAGLHSHFPLWAPDAAFLYFVQGELPDKLDIWRIRPAGGRPERITFQDARITYPVLLDRRTLLYLAGDPEGTGQALYEMDVERRIPHRLTPGLDQFTSLSASADGHRLVVTRTTPIKTFWRLHIADAHAEIAKPEPIPLTTTNGFSPRFGPGYLLYVSATGSGESIWKLANDKSTELWRGNGVHVFGGPAITPDGKQIAFSVRQNDRTYLYVMAADGTNPRVVMDSLHLTGSPAWLPGGNSLTVAAEDQGRPQLFSVSLDGRQAVPFLQEQARDPAWAPDGSFVAYSGPDIGTTFSVKAVTKEAKPYALPDLTLTRGARHLVFLPGRRALVFLRGGIEHRNLWLVDLGNGSERPLSNLDPDFEVSDFDISPDGQEVVMERAQQRSNVEILDLPNQR